MLLERSPFLDAFHPIIEECLRIYPSSVRKDHYGNLPLHMALESGAPSSCVLHIFSLYPEAAARKTSHNAWPLHIAVEKAYTGQILEILLKAHPDVLFHRGNNNLLPIQTAIQNSMPIEDVLLLLD